MTAAIRLSLTPLAKGLTISTQPTTGIYAWRVAEPSPNPERVVALRRASLLRAGYTAAQAEELARRLEVDLQAALAPRRQGLPPEVAFQLALSGGGRTVF